MTSLLDPSVIKGIHGDLIDAICLDSFKRTWSQAEKYTLLDYVENKELGR